jgi:transcriptional antiterminator RfaH
MDNWYLVYCKPREELRAQQHLANLGFVSYVPLLTKQKTRAGQAVASSEPLFPRYLFLQANSTDNLSVVKNTRGVSDFVRFGGKLAEVPSSLIEQLTCMQIQLQQQESEKTSYQAGEALTVLTGLFSGLSAVYQMADGAGRSLVLIQLLNNAVPLSLANTELAKASATATNSNNSA